MTAEQMEMARDRAPVTARLITRMIESTLIAPAVQGSSSGAALHIATASRVPRRISFDGHGGGGWSRAGYTPTMEEARSAHIVLAEDEPMIGRILDFKLGMEGHRVTWVRTAAEAERLCLGGGVDLLLCDVTLEEDGRALCRRLIESGNAPRAGVVLMPEQRDPEGERLALDAGARDVVIKPFKPTLVAAKVRRLLEEQS